MFQKIGDKIAAAANNHPTIARTVDVVLRVAGVPAFAAGALSTGTALIAEALSSPPTTSLISQNESLSGGTTSDEAAASLSRISATPTTQDLQAALAPQTTQGGYLNTDPGQSAASEQSPSQDVRLLSPVAAEDVWDELMLDHELEDLLNVVEAEALFDQFMETDEPDSLLRFLQGGTRLLPGSRLPNSWCMYSGNWNLKLTKNQTWIGRLLLMSG